MNIFLDIAKWFQCRITADYAIVKDNLWDEYEYKYTLWDGYKYITSFQSKTPLTNINN